MKEFGFAIDKHLQIGLRPDYRMNKNSLGMLELFNLEPTPYGLSPYTPVEIPWTDGQLSTMGIELNWPFPQLIRLKKYTLLMGAAYMFIVNEDDWTLTQVDTYDYYSPSTAKAITAGSLWQAIDFWDVFMLVNGRCSLIYDKANDKMLVEDTVRIQSGCDYKGRAMFGGFDAEHYWSAAWQTYWASNPSSIVGSQPAGLDKSWISWTNVGGGDLDLIFDADVKQNDLLKNEAGSMPMHYRDLICHQKVLNEKVVVYGYNGVSVVSHKSSPISTIGIDKHYLSTGIANIGAMAGDDDNHIYVDARGYVKWIDRSFKVTTLGYLEFVGNMLGDDIIVSHNPVDGSFYISTSSVTYIISWDMDKNQPHGMAEIGQRITSCIGVGDTCYGLGSDIGSTVDSIKMKFTTDIINLNRVGIKTIRWIQVAGEEGILDTSAGTMYARIWYRNSQRKKFESTSWRKFNKEGACYFPVGGVDFKIELKASDFRLINISQIYVTFQFDDRRFSRSVDVTQTNG